jgi:hypothetical protein
MRQQRDRYLTRQSKEVSRAIWKRLLADLKARSVLKEVLMYVVTGATENTGSVIADALLATGKKVRVIGRDAKRLERFTHKGAEAFVADPTDAAAITNAFAGAEAAYLMIPPFQGRVRRSDWQARPYLSTVASRAAEVRLPTNGPVSQRGRSLARNGRSHEYKTREDARTSLVSEQHSDDD